MKMENNIVAKKDLVVTNVVVSIDEMVDAGQVLVKFE